MIKTWIPSQVVSAKSRQVEQFRAKTANPHASHSQIFDISRLTDQIINDDTIGRKNN